MMLLKDLLQSAKLPIPEGVGDREITGISSDSRRVRPGELFVALRGLRQDGLSHLPEAMDRGATFLVAERAAEGIDSLTVEDARFALSALLDAWHGHPARELKLVGVTGTNGKTSTATMLYHILRYAGCSVGLIGTVECLCNDERITPDRADDLSNMTTPDPEELYALLHEMRKRGAQYVVMEVTSHALALSKVKPLEFERAVFTNLSTEHLDFHGDTEAYYLEKRKLFAQCRRAVVSRFSHWGRRLFGELWVPADTVGAENVFEIRQRGCEGIDFTLVRGVDRIPISLSMPGDFFVENGALAAMTALSLGVAPDTVSEALRCFRGVRGRMERVSGNEDDIRVFLDYAHTPEALEKLLRSVRGFRSAGERILLLFGCGGERDRSKRKEMGRIATRQADLTVITADNSRGEPLQAIFADILKGVDKEKAFAVIENRAEAIRFAVESAARGDILLLAGKGHEEYEICGGRRLPFSEREIVRRCLAARREGGCYAD